MKVTPFSDGQYYPLTLANGRDSVMIDYGGSGFLSLNGHTHFDPHQGSPVAWYKTANMKKGEKLTPIVKAGVQVILFGAPAEPTFYEQEFTPEEATVRTDVTFRYGIKIRITSFLTKDSIWYEKLELTENPQNRNVTLAFRLNYPSLGFRLGVYATEVKTVFSPEESALDFTYVNGDYTGKGTLIADKAFDKTVCDEDFTEGIYENVPVGFTVCRAMLVLGDNEHHTDYETLLEKAKISFDDAHPAHAKEWGDYFATSSITLPDEKLQYLYRMSRYLIRAYQHPDTGIISLGLQPNHWNGAIYCSWDARFPHAALLTTGNFKESTHFINSFIKVAPKKRALLEQHGLPGLSFSGWTTLLGDFFGARELADWLINFKPGFCNSVIFEIYNEWAVNPAGITDEHIQIAESITEFWLAVLVKKGPDGLYRIIDMKDSGEAGIDVALDSSIQTDIARCFDYLFQMTGKPEYKDISQKMFAALEVNRNEDGMLLPYTGAEHHTSDAILNYYYTSLDGLYSKKDLMTVIEESITPWGNDNCLTAEEYRHWPWYDTWVALDAIVAREPKLAEQHLRHATYGSSATGILPEKLRLDGHAVNYGYVSPHSLSVMALCAGLAYAVQEGQLLLGYGYTRDFGDVRGENIHTLGGLSVSIDIQSGRIASLRIQNLSEKDKHIALDVNPDYADTKIPREIFLPSGQDYTYRT